MKPIFKHWQSGLTLIELLIALSIVAVIILLMTLGQGLSLSRGEDARRKSDLAKLKVAFEDYYNDHNCYPEPTLLQTCGGADLSPYVAKIPCDPRLKTPYPYYWDASCSWYALYTTLEDKTDPIITTLGCFPTCGVTGKPYNYIQSNGKLMPSQIAAIIDAGGAVTIEPGPTPTPPGGGGTPTPSPSGSSTPTPSPSGSGTPTPSPSGPGNNLACDPNGQCNYYADPVGSGCPITYSNPHLCQQACADPVNRCAK